ncbi:MAG: hypothetical protein OEY28_09430 [Nitrospira sp.]|nr:hypothetical protein [Nitrospira sp.]
MSRVNRPAWSRLALEGLAVLFGVLAAFWVESVGQAYANLEKVEAHLGALRSEISINQQILEAQIGNGRRMVDTIEHYLATVILPEAGASPGREEVTDMLKVTGPPQLVEYQRGALDDLLAGGGLPILDDELVRQGVLTYARLLADEADAQQSIDRFWSDQIGPYYFEYGSLLDFMPVGEELNLEAHPPVIDAFVRSRQFSNLMAERRQFELRLLRRRTMLETQTDSLVALIR